MIYSIIITLLALWLAYMYLDCAKIYAKTYLECKKLQQDKEIIWNEKTELIYALGIADEILKRETGKTLQEWRKSE